MVFGYIDMKRLIAILLSCVALSVNAETYYISPSGSNTAGNGTSSNPWQTPIYAISQASAGDTIFFSGRDISDNNSNRSAKGNFIIY